MQYTGLKDKNSKEIYEGDIVLQTHPHPDDKDDVALVKYGEHISADPHHYGGWTIGFYAGDPEAAFSLLEKENRFEVIGNIYENPELIQQAV